MIYLKKIRIKLIYLCSLKLIISICYASHQLEMGWRNTNSKLFHQNINLLVAMYCKLLRHRIFHFLLYMVIGNVFSLSSITSVFIKLLTALNVVFLIPIFSVCFRFWTYILALGEFCIPNSISLLPISFSIIH